MTKRSTNFNGRYRQRHVASSPEGIAAAIKHLGLPLDEQKELARKILAKECQFTHVGLHIDSPSKPGICWYCGAVMNIGGSRE